MLLLTRLLERFLRMFIGGIVGLFWLFGLLCVVLLCDYWNWRWSKLLIFMLDFHLYFFLFLNIRLLYFFLLINFFLFPYFFLFLLFDTSFLKLQFFFFFLLQFPQIRISFFCLLLILIYLTHNYIKYI